jgi:tRNA(Ile)-lysidine synthase
MPQSLRHHLLSTLQALPPARRYLVAFSGGLDSTVLLHLMAGLRGELGAEVAALHIDHGLAAHSAEWSEQCRAFCERLAVPFALHRVEVKRQGVQGLEAAARHARYLAFGEALGEGEMLLTAHHRDDQAETLLLQLLRGGGVHGLAAMPSWRHFCRGVIARPLLGQPREALRCYAEEQGLVWIEDPSNFDTGLERNWLRHTLLPQLAERRAGIREVLVRSAGHFAESAALLDDLALQDLVHAEREQATLSVAALKRLSPERCRNLLRYAIRQRGLPLPDHRHLHRILDEVLSAAMDAMPLVAWPGAEVRRYRDRLFLLPPLPPVPESTLELPWNGESEIRLPQGLGMLRIRRVQGKGISSQRITAGACTIHWRRGGEALQPTGRGEHHALKKLYQEAGVPPWERSRRPLIFLGGKLAQVPWLWSAAEFAAMPEEVGIVFDWQPFPVEKERQNNDNCRVLGDDGFGH